jgi:SAM-dependent methyltransferase
LNTASALSATERFLAEFHEAHAGLTAHAFGALPVWRNGECLASSYDCLAQVVTPISEPATVLDLACGDGLLLSRLSQKRASGHTLIGIDMSRAELHAARSRLGVGAALQQAMAQALPLPDASVDCVLCHLALMLMAPVEPVIAEVRRVLKPGGVFSAVVGTRPPPHAAFDAYVALLAEFPRRAGFEGLNFGDPRVRTLQGMAELLGAAFADLRCDDLEIRRRCTPQELWAWYGDMYDLHLVDPQDRISMQHRFLASTAPLCGPDRRLDDLQRLRQYTATAM